MAALGTGQGSLLGFSVRNLVGMVVIGQWVGLDDLSGVFLPE